MDQNHLLNLPLYVLLVFLVIGLVGSWRRAIAMLIFSYVALIIAAQHNEAIAGTNLISSLSSESSYLSRSALAYALSAAVVFLLLGILFSVVWGRPKNQAQDYSGLDRLAQSLIAGVSGWSLGVMLAICLLVYQGADLHSARESPEREFYANVVESTAATVVDLVNPWLPDGPPQFLAALDSLPE